MALNTEGHHGSRPPAQIISADYPDPTGSFFLTDKLVDGLDQLAAFGEELTKEADLLVDLASGNLDVLIDLAIRFGLEATKQNILGIVDVAVNLAYQTGLGFEEG